MAMYYGQQTFFERKVRFEWIKESWGLFSAAQGAWIGAGLMLVVLFLGVEFGLFGVTGMLPYIFHASEYPLGAEYGRPAYWVVTLLMNVLGAFLSAGMLRMANAQVRGEQISAWMLFQGAPAFLGVFIYQILFSIMYLIGMALCLLPAFLVMGLFAPGLALVADGDPVIASFERSARAMSSDWLMAWLFALAAILLFAIGAGCTCGIGMLAVIPMQYLILSLAYRDMIGMPGGNAADAPPSVYPAAPGAWPPAPSPYQQPQAPPQAGYPTSQGIWPPPQRRSAEPPPQPDTPWSPAAAPEEREPDQGGSNEQT